MAEIEYLVFSIDKKFYAIEISYVQEINRLKELIINKVPNAPDRIYGLLNLRGNVIPIIDIRETFELNIIEVSNKTRVIILNYSKKLIGFIVDKIEYIDKFNEDNILDPPDEIKMNNQYVSKIVHNKKVILVLDIQKIIEGKSVFKPVNK